MKVLLLTTHLYSSKHKAGFHNLARCLCELGHQVFFCTTPNSLLNLLWDLLKNPQKFPTRFQTFLYAFFPKRLDEVIATSYVSIIYNYSHSSIFSHLKRRLFLWGYCRAFYQNKFELIIFESCVSIFLFNRLKKLNPMAKIVYRVSDPLVVLKADPLLLEHEKKCLQEFDHVSVPNDRLGNLIRSINSKISMAVLPHGIDKKVLTETKKESSPYHQPNNFLYVGMFLFDYDFLKIASRLRPDCSFHLIGNIPREVQGKNIHYYGIMPFKEMLPYIIHCDVALLTRRTSRNLEIYAKSLKFFQYTFYQKPILAPQEMDLHLSHVFSYRLTEESIDSAIRRALNFDPSGVDFSEILDWSEVTQKLLLDTFQT